MQMQNLAPALEVSVSARTHGWVRGLHLVLDHRGLILRGRVRSYYAKQLVQHIVMEATGMPIVTNDIEVVGATGETGA